MQIEGKTAIITGGATGIGRATALQLAREGANVVINYSKSEQEAKETLQEVERLGGRGLIVQASVGDDEQVVSMVKKTVETFGGIDILINNAGTTHFVDLDDLSGLKEQYWDDIHQINVKGTFFVSRACAEHLKKNNGCIVNITSIAGITGGGSSIAYAASKAAGISMTKSLAKALAPHIRVNSIAPGIVQTRWVKDHEDHVKRYSEGTPLGRAATPEDIADMTVALIRGGDFVTGQTIVVDGGWSL